MAAVIVSARSSQRRLRRGTFVLLVSLGVVAGCDADPENCTDDPCNRLAIAPNGHDDGTVRWNGDAMTLVAAPPFQSTAPRAGACIATLEQYGGKENYADEPPSWTLAVHMRCTSSDGTETLWLEGLVLDDDVLAEAPSTKHIVSPRPVAGEEQGAYFEVGGTLTVEESVGGVAPEPELVTSDFRRVIRFELDPTLLDRAAPDLDVSLRFTLGADDFHYQPDQTCRVCAG